MNSFHLFNEGFCFSLGFWLLLGFHSVVLAGLELTKQARLASNSRDLTASTSQMVRLKVCTTLISLIRVLWGAGFLFYFFNVATEGIYCSPFQLDRVD